MFIGEAPGADEDKEGRPFVGKSGRRLDDLLANISLDREAVFITNVVKCRPPSNREPWPKEVRRCKRHLDRQITAINPKMIVTLGNQPLKHFMRGHISDLHGQPQKIDGRIVFPCYHPAAASTTRQRPGPKKLTSIFCRVS
jgi:DNA polymerase